MSLGHASAADWSRPTTSLGNQDVRTAPSLRWMKIMSVLSIAPLQILMGLYQSWIQAEVGLLGGFVLEDLPLVVTRLQSQRHSPRIFRIFVKMSVSNMLHQNVFDGMYLLKVAPLSY